LKSKSNVLLSIFDVTGKKVRVLVSSVQRAGKYEILFDATGLSSGIYFYKLSIEGNSKTKKMFFAK
jgi:hypothetical protein